VQVEKESVALNESPADKLIAACINKRFMELSRGGWAEEWERFEPRMFHQLKQWLEKSTKNRRKIVPVKVAGDREKS
jgi:hypothetical protein